MNRRLKIFCFVALAVISLTVLTESLPTPTFIGPIDTSFLTLPLMPGYIVYIIITGDIHGSQPGPIGFGGRVAVSSFFNILFWLFVVFKLTKKKTKSLAE